MAVQTKHRTDSSDEGFNGSGELKFGLTEVVYEWAKGMVSSALLTSMAAKFMQYSPPLAGL